MTSKILEIIKKIIEGIMENTRGNVAEISDVALVGILE